MSDAKQTYINEKLDVVEVLGQRALFSNGKIAECEVADGLYKYDLREGDGIAFATVEKHVIVNHSGTILVKEPLNLGAQGYIEFDEDTSLNFLGYEMTPQEFINTGIKQTEEGNERVTRD